MTFVRQNKYIAHRSDVLNKCSSTIEGIYEMEIRFYGTTHKVYAKNNKYIIVATMEYVMQKWAKVEALPNNIGKSTT